MEVLKKFFKSIGCRCCLIIESYTESHLPNSQSDEINRTPFPKISQCLLKEIKLNLIIIESENMQVGKVFQITPLGLSNTDRTKNDGQVFAGTSYYEGSKIVNDIILPPAEGVGKKHFLIEYKSAPQPGYYLKDLGEGKGTFIRLTRPLAIKTNYIISIGDSLIIVFIDNSSHSLNLRFFDDPKSQEKYKFSPENSPIKIGRMSDCEIMLNDKALSRYQCQVLYKDGWVIEDGNGKRASTNGTWIYAEDHFLIYNAMLFKVGETLFRADLS